MNRTAYKNQYIQEHYDRINLTLPKGQKERVRGICEAMNVSVNEYLYMLVCNDLASGTSRMAAKKQGFSAEQERMLDKWQIAGKYRKMIESMDIEEINGMNKYYTIILKKGYINDVTGSRQIYTNKMKELRRIITKSHKQ